MIDLQELFYPLETCRRFSSHRKVVEVFLGKGDLYSSHSKSVGDLLAVGDQQEVFQPQETRRSFFIAIEDLNEFFQLQEICRTASSYRRPVGGSLSKEDVKIVFQSQESCRRPSIHRCRQEVSYTQETFRWSLILARVLLPIEGLQDAFDPLETCRRYLIYRRPVGLLFMGEMGFRLSMA